LSRSCLRSRRMKASFFFIALKYWVFSGKWFLSRRVTSSKIFFQLCSAFLLSKI
jgi:hypothetical protein